MGTVYIGIKYIFLVLVAISAATIPVEVIRNYFLQKKIKKILKNNATMQK